MIRSTNSAILTFGLVAIPVKFYTAASANRVSFNLITKSGNRVKQSFEDAVTGTIVSRGECDHGFQVSSDTYVVFTKEEIKELQSKGDGTIEIREFVEASTVDLAAIEKSHYVGPNKGGDRGYKLLAETMKALDKVAVAKWTVRGSDKLLVIRPYKGGLLAQEMFFAHEVRSFDELVAADVKVSDAERSMAAQLVASLTTSTGYNSSGYEDEFRKRVDTAVALRQLGNLMPTPEPEKPKRNVMDLLELLKQSLTTTEGSRQ